MVVQGLEGQRWMFEPYPTVQYYARERTLVQEVGNFPVFQASYCQIPD